jgi:hypothetical protein
LLFQGLLPEEVCFTLALDCNPVQKEAALPEPNHTLSKIVKAKSRAIGCLDRDVQMIVVRMKDQISGLAYIHIHP